MSLQGVEVYVATTTKLPNNDELAKRDNVHFYILPTKISSRGIYSSKTHLFGKNRKEFSEKAYELVKLYTVRDSTEVPFNNYVSVILSGPQRDIRELDWKQVSAQVTIKPEEWPETEGYRVGQIELTKEHFHLPSRSLRVVENSIRPSVIYFQLSPVVIRPIQIRPVITGTPPSPYRLSPSRRWVVQPKELYVRGPEQYFSFFELVTEVIDVTDVEPEGLRYTVTVPVRLQLRSEFRTGGKQLPELVNCLLYTSPSPRD